jgi:Protein of unknown function (DUF2914)
MTSDSVSDLDLADRNSPPQTNSQQAAADWPPTWFLKIPGFARLYQKHEKHIPVIVFAVGCIWDSFTMTRVDSVIDNIILLGYLFALAFMSFSTIRRRIGFTPPGWVRRMEPYFPWAMQFAFGGLFSSYVVFYFKSVSWTRTQFFFIILLILLVGNEFLHHRLQNDKLLAVLYSFCLLSFLAFFLPVILARVGTGIFLLAGLISVVASTCIFGWAYWVDRNSFRKRFTTFLVCIGLTWLTVNTLFFANLIPPVPLALKNGGIYHSVRKTTSGYEVSYVRPPFYRFWRQGDDPFLFSPGESIYCFSAIFAPRRVRVPIIHVWSYFDPSTGWQITDRIGFQIAGGRDGGYRGFSHKSAIWPGEWRVQVETTQGQILGKIDFSVAMSPTPHPSLETKIIQ